MTDEQISTMTGPELSQAIAEAMGWRLEPYWGADKEPAWVDAEGRWKCWPAHLPSPSTNWSHWGLVYEFMVGEGWWAQIWMMPEITRWAWCKGGFKGHGIAYVEEHDPDLRTASVKAALKALWMREGRFDSGMGL